MVKIKCKRCREGGGDWVGANAGDYHRYFLCNDGALEWWHTDHLQEMTIVMSHEDHEEAYKCRMSRSDLFEIQDPGTNRWWHYLLYLNLEEAIIVAGYNNSVPFYISLQERT